MSKKNNEPMTERCKRYWNNSKKFIWQSWGMHNIIGHPMMQFCNWLQMPLLGAWFHDSTLPEKKTEDKE